MEETRVFKQTIISTSNIYIYEIMGEIEGPDAYMEMIQTMRIADENDQVIITLNTPGGSVSTSIQIINAINSCSATVTTIIVGDCHSMGGIIFLSGDIQIVDPDCMMLCHNYSGGTIGKGNEQQAEVEAITKWFTTICEKYYAGFLTKREIKQLLDGKDFWFSSVEVEKRLKRRNKGHK